MEDDAIPAFDYEKSIATIRQRFVSRLKYQVVELDDLMERIEAFPSDGLAINAAIDLVHKIAGVAPTLGLAKIGLLAAKAERGLLGLSESPDWDTVATTLAMVENLTIELDIVEFGIALDAEKGLEEPHQIGL